jgi:hypothetical protein
MAKKIGMSSPASNGSRWRPSLFEMVFTSYSSERLPRESNQSVDTIAAIEILVVTLEEECLNKKVEFFSADLHPFL